MHSDRKKLLLKLQKLLPADELLLESSVCQQYAGDKWMAAFLPEAVALPRSTASISALLSFANERQIPITPRGSGYGYVGGCVPVRGGIVLSVERMSRIKEIHSGDFVAVVQAGVITKKLQD